MNGRPAHEWTATALSWGTVISAALLAAAFVLSLAQSTSAASLLATAGVLVLLATPAIGLVLTFLELRPVQPRAAMLALAVLGVLGLSAAVAVFAR